MTHTKHFCCTNSTRCASFNTLGFGVIVGDPPGEHNDTASTTLLQEILHLHLCDVSHVDLHYTSNLIVSPIIHWLTRSQILLFLLAAKNFQHLMEK